MRFAYRDYPSEFAEDGTPTSFESRPALKVRVSGTADEALLLWGILDTGSEISILPWDIAQEIKPTWDGPVEEVASFTGATSYVRYGTIDLQIRLKGLPVRWSASVAFHPDRLEALWGVAGFLEHFRVTFDGPKRHFTIRLPKQKTAGPAPLRGKVDEAIGPDDQDP